MLIGCVLCRDEDPFFFFLPISDPGLCTSNEKRFLKKCLMNILDNLKSFYFLFSYFWCQASSVSRIALDPDPDPVRIFTDADPGWFYGSRISDTKSMVTKKNDFKTISNIQLIEFTKKNSIRSKYRARIRIWQKPDPHPWFYALQ